MRRDVSLWDSKCWNGRQKLVAKTQRWAKIGCKNATVGKNGLNNLATIRTVGAGLVAVDAEGGVATGCLGGLHFAQRVCGGKKILIF